MREKKEQLCRHRSEKIWYQVGCEQPAGAIPATTQLPGTSVDSLYMVHVCYYIITHIYNNSYINVCIIS